MSIRASAPARCGLVGNPTDGYGGTVISSSVSERATVEITPASGFELSICGQQETLAGVDDLRLTGGFTDVAKAVLLKYPEALQTGGFLLHGDTTVPIQAGLAGSTVMLIAILGGVLRLLGRELSKYEIAETARDIEFNIMNVVCGFQDHYMVVFGGVNCLDFRGKDPHAAGDLPFAMVENLEPYLPEFPYLLANTGVQRDSGSVHRPLRQRWIEGDLEVVQGYERAAGLARTAKKAMLSGDWRTVGGLMNENHVIQRDLGGSGEANELLIAAALRAGAFGAKLAGAGKGGTIIALHEDLDYLSGALLEAGAARILRVIPSSGLTVHGTW